MRLRGHARRYPLLKQGIRINAICPGPTDTPAGPGQQGDVARLRRRLPRRGRRRGRRPRSSRPTRSCSCAATRPAINGITVVSDAGYFSAGLTGSFPDATPIAQFLTGKL